MFAQIMYTLKHLTQYRTLKRLINISYYFFIV